MKNFFRNLLTLILLLTSVSAWAAGGETPPLYISWWKGPCGSPSLPNNVTYSPDFQVDGKYYKIIEGGVELTCDYHEGVTTYKISHLTIPASVTYEGIAYPVIRIGDAVFRGNIWIETVTIPEGVKSIGRDAFFRTPLLTDLHLPSSLEIIESSAFAYSAIKNINLYDGVKYLGKNAFSGCENLASVTFGQEVSEIGQEVFGYSFEIFYSKYADVQYIWYTDIKDLYCLSRIPAEVDGSLFDIFTYDRPKKTMNMYEVTVLHVPAESVELYKQTAPWNQFKTILGDGESSVTETVAKAEGIRLEGGRIVGEGVMDVYDLGGRQVARGTAEQLPELPAGFYIVRNASTAAKILVP